MDNCGLFSPILPDSRRKSPRGNRKLHCIEMRMTLSWIACVLLTLTLSPHFSTAQQQCRTPNNGQGMCVYYKRCSFVMTVYQRYGNSIPSEVRSYLHQSRCDTHRNEVYICCSLLHVMPEEEGISTDNIEGSAERRRIAPTTPSPPITTTSSLSNSERIARGLAILNATKCGASSEFRVAYGKEVQLREFPWMALLRSNTVQPWNCGASLITDRFVLTAAHCIVGQPSRIIGVRLGEHNIDTDTDCQQKGEKLVCSPPVEDYGIEAYIPHPQYNRAHFVNDVALLKLDRVVQFQKHIKPICLPITRQSRNLLNDQPYIVAGWGLTELGVQSNVLLKANLTQRSVDVCKDTFKSQRFTSNHLCIGSDEKSDSCKGDSGGPLFSKQLYQPFRPRYIQYGIVSGGTTCSTKRTLPGVYTSVIDLLPWIVSQIGAS